MDTRQGFRITAQLVIGVSIAVVGVLFTLDNLHVLRARDYLQFWPLALVAIGLVHVAQARTAAGVVGGAIWILIGATLLGNRLGFIDINVWNYWPLLLVLVGGRIVLQTMSGEAPRGGGLFVLNTGAGDAKTGSDPGSLVSAVAVMGGFARKVTSQEFRGGELTAFMGGGKLDLREAAPAGGQAVLNVFALMGGFEVLVPETWCVISEVTPFMGGIEDKARTSTSPSAPRLIIRGFVMMGGVTLKNS